MLLSLVEEAVVKIEQAVEEQLPPPAQPPEEELPAAEEAAQEPPLPPPPLPPPLPPPPLPPPPPPFPPTSPPPSAPETLLLFGGSTLVLALSPPAFSIVFGPRAIIALEGDEGELVYFELDAAGQLLETAKHETERLARRVAEAAWGILL